MARFVGKLDFAPQDPDRPDDERKLSQDFGFVRDDGLMVIAQSGGSVDGASIPRTLWRLIGHPLYKGNRFWSVPHDALYRRFAVIIDLNSAQVTPETALDVWREMDCTPFVHARSLSRKWCDKTLRQAMVAMHERRLKRRAVYLAVRMFGWRSYRK
jgi:hypothetical protein